MQKELLITSTLAITFGSLFSGPADEVRVTAEPAAPVPAFSMWLSEEPAEMCEDSLKGTIGLDVGFDKNSLVLSLEHAGQTATFLKEVQFGSGVVTLEDLVNFASRSISEQTKQTSL